MSSTSLTGYSIVKLKTPCGPPS